MRDNAETDPDTIFATALDGRNAVLNVSKQESLGLVTAGIAPAVAGGSSGTSGGWVNFQAAEAVAIPGQYSEAPVFTGGGGGGSTGGGGGYVGDGGGSGFDCARLDQWTRVRGEDGLWVPRLVADLTLEDWLWHPILERFFKIRHAEVLRRPIWKLITGSGAVGYSAGMHPIIRSRRDYCGLPIESYGPKQSVLCVGEWGLVDSWAVSAENTGELADVMWLEIEADNVGDKIYCYGEDPKMLIVCHNLKPRFEEPVVV